jgi:4-amino-4-deoxy-L-arabinose transferase-like glycosyltransferase
LSRRLWLWLIPLLLLVTWLGAWRINADILFVDEYWSIRNSGGDPFGGLNFKGVWERTATLDPGGMGVLYHWLLNAWGRLIGWSIFSVRAFSLLAGLLTVAMTYRLGSTLFNRHVGLYSAVALGLSAFFIDYLHEARAYTLLALFVSFAIYAYQKIMFGHLPSLLLWGGDVKRSDTGVGYGIFWYIALTLSLAALAYTHYVALAIGVVLGVFHLTQFHNDRRWWAVVVAMAIGGLLFVPWLGITVSVIQEGAVDTNRQQTSMNTLQILQNLLDTYSNANLALLGLLLILTLRQRTKSLLLLWIWLIVSVLMAMLVNAAIPFMVHLRYLMIVFPALALLSGLGMWQMSKMGVPARLVVLVWIGVGLYQTFNPAFIPLQFGQIYRAPAAGFNRAYEILQTRATEGDMALFHIIPPGYESFNLFVLGYYFNPLDEPHPRIRYDQIERMNNSDAAPDNEYLRAVWDSLANAPAVWTMRIPELPTTQHSNVVNFALDTAYSRCEVVFAQDDMLMEFHARIPDAEPDAIFAHDEAAQIAIYDLQRGYQTENLLHVTLGFAAENVPPGMYSLSVYLLDSNGAKVSQYDSGMPDDRPFSCTAISLSLDNLAAGEYSLQAIIYNWQTGERLLTGESDFIELNTITVNHN